MNNIDKRLTINFDEDFVPKGCCTINKNGEADNCNSCYKTCLNNVCDNYPIQKCFNKLGKLEDIIEKHTLIDVPVKVGSEVFKIVPTTHPLYNNFDYYSYVVGHIVEINTSISECDIVPNKTIKVKFCNNTFNTYNTKLLGETIFLTEDEVKNRIKELSFKI